MSIPREDGQKQQFDVIDGQATEVIVMLNQQVVSYHSCSSGYQCLEDGGRNQSVVLSPHLLPSCACISGGSASSRLVL